MHIKYFADTDTTLVEFSEKPSVETRELNENIYIDLDSDGRVVSLTIEHQSRKPGYLPGIVMTIRIEYHRYGATCFKGMPKTEKNCIRFSCSIFELDYFSIG